MRKARSPSREDLRLGRQDFTTLSRARWDGSELRRRICRRASSVSRALLRSCDNSPRASSEAGALAVAAFQRALDFPIRCPAREHVALVVRVLALGESQLDLGAAVFEIDFQGNDRIALLAHAAPQLIDLAPMHQEFARAGFLVAELAGRSVGADVDALEKRLPVFDARVAVAQICAMSAQRLDLGAGEREAGLEGLLDEEVVASLAVVNVQLESVGGRLAVASMRIARHIRVSLSAHGDADKGHAGMVANAAAGP